MPGLACCDMKGADGPLAIGRQQNAQLKKQNVSDLLNVSRDAQPDLSKVATPEHASLMDDSPPSLEEFQHMTDELRNHKAAQQTKWRQNSLAQTSYQSNDIAMIESQLRW